MKPLIILPIMAMLTACAHSPSELRTQADVDLNRYAGTWHEQARVPNRFQRDCAADVRAHYLVRPDNTIGVINQCRTKDGDIKVAEGVGRLSRAFDPPDPAKLEVRFAPDWTSRLPFVWGDYWILKIADDYRYSLVGTPDRKYLWVLSRDEKADRDVVSALLELARSLGFPVDEVVGSAK
jgi:apolipoprotein D and lipocalin family protein